MKKLLKYDYNLIKSKSNNIFIPITLIIALSVYISWNNPAVGILIAPFVFCACSFLTFEQFEQNKKTKMKASSNKTLIFEKYVFSFLSVLIASTISALLISIIFWDKTINKDLTLWICEILISIILPFILTSLIIPIILKFGNKAGRILMFLLIVFALNSYKILNYDFFNIFSTLKISISFLPIINVIILTFIMGIIFVISFLISTKVNKQQLL